VSVFSPLSPLVATVSPGVAVACVAGAYLLGTFPSAWLATRRRGVDPTAAGSGNPGATNVYRTVGRRAGVLTLAGDVFKGAVAAALGWAIGGHGLGVACGVAAVVGHVAPLRGFRGGKGVATVAGMALVLFPLAALVSAAAFGAVTAISRTVSLGSIAGVAVLPAAAGALGAPGREVAALAGCAVIVIARHRGNIGRLWRGEEPHLGTAA
jgi:acyl phosphate:glycerol-3-phosphate acyltransferase